jgi:hypothetical protein
MQNRTFCPRRDETGKLNIPCNEMNHTKLDSCRIHGSAKFIDHLKILSNGGKQLLINGNRNYVRDSAAATLSSDSFSSTHRYPLNECLTGAHILRGSNCRI